VSIAQPASTRARPSAEATGRHEKEGWFIGMVVPFSRPYFFSFNVRSFFTDFTPGTFQAVQDA
jgi:beta-lactamase class D